MYKYNLIKERFDIPVTEPGQAFRGEFELDKNANFLMAIALTSDRDDLLYYRGTNKIQLNDVELFPEKFESRLLLSGINVSPGERMINLGGLLTGNGKLDVLYTDNDHPNIEFSPYRVTIYTFSSIDKQPLP